MRVERSTRELVSFWVVVMKEKTQSSAESHLKTKKDIKHNYNK